MSPFRPGDRVTARIGKDGFGGKMETGTVVRVRPDSKVEFTTDDGWPLWAYERNTRLAEADERTSPRGGGMKALAVLIWIAGIAISFWIGSLLPDGADTLGMIIGGAIGITGGLIGSVVWSMGDDRGR